MGFLPRTGESMLAGVIIVPADDGPEALSHFTAIVSGYDLTDKRGIQVRLY